MSVSDSLIRKILEAKTIAVVGLSKDPMKPSQEVARYLQSNSYRIIPINPTIDKVLGEISYKSLLDMPEDLKRNVEVVEIFRKTEDVPPIVEQAVELHNKYGRPTTVWMQLGIVNEDAAKRAKDAGLNVIMDHCMKVEHQRLVASK